MEGAYTALSEAIPRSADERRVIPYATVEACGHTRWLMRLVGLTMCLNTATDLAFEVVEEVSARVPTAWFSYWRCGPGIAWCICYLALARGYAGAVLAMAGLALIGPLLPRGASESGTSMLAGLPLLVLMYMGFQRMFGGQARPTMYASEMEEIGWFARVLGMYGMAGGLLLAYVVWREYFYPSNSLRMMGPLQCGVAIAIGLFASVLCAIGVWFSRPFWLRAVACSLVTMVGWNCSMWWRIYRMSSYPWRLIPVIGIMRVVIPNAVVIVGFEMLYRRLSEKREATTVDG